MATEKIIRKVANKVNEENSLNVIRKEKFLSIKYQLDWIKGLKAQVDWANNPEVLSDFVLYLGIRRRFEDWH